MYTCIHIYIYIYRERERDRYWVRFYLGSTRIAFLPKDLPD